MYCRNCKTTIDTKRIIYRGFDMNFCSNNCRLCIEKAIIKIDPSITKFTDWASVSALTPLSNEMCYYNVRKRNSLLPITISIFKSLDLKYFNKHHYNTVLYEIYNIFNYTTSYSLKLIYIINNSLMFFYKS